MKLAIRFHDNDFHNCFCGVLQVFRDAEEISEESEWKRHHAPSNLTKAQICQIINEISLGCYLIHQNRFRYGLEHFEHIREYLKITPDRLYLDQEVPEYLDQVNGNNGETFVLSDGEIFAW
jgi:hypothetical protein